MVQVWFGLVWFVSPSPPLYLLMSISDAVSLFWQVIQLYL